MKAVDLLEGRETPVEWDEWDEIQRLDWIASRILAEDRSDSEITSHTELKDGYSYLSGPQEERRKKKEVQWNLYPTSLSWLENKLYTGQLYSRSYIKKEWGDGVNPIDYYEASEKDLLAEGDEYPYEYLHWFINNRMDDYENS